MREIKFRAGCKFHKATMDVTNIHFWSDGKITTTHQCGCPDVDIIQYVGLKDKNGKEIYEGDIVKFMDCCKEEFRGYIEYSKDKFTAYREPKSFAMASNQTHDLYGDFEIIGNIYENPELVKP